jgi:hypothetical protein
MRRAPEAGSEEDVMKLKAIPVLAIGFATAVLALLPVWQLMVVSLLTHAMAAALAALL